MTVVWGLYANHLKEHGRRVWVFSCPELAKNCKSIALNLREDGEEREGYWKCDAFSHCEGDEVFYYTARANRS